MADALCREYLGVVDWFPTRGETPDPARAICSRCLVRAECLDHAMQTDQHDGVWPGTSATQRRHAACEGWTAQSYSTRPRPEDLHEEALVLVVVIRELVGQQQEPDDRTVDARGARRRARSQGFRDPVQAIDGRRVAS